MNKIPFAGSHSDEREGGECYVHGLHRNWVFKVLEINDVTVIVEGPREKTEKSGLLPKPPRTPPPLHSSKSDYRSVWLVAHLRLFLIAGTTTC